MAIMHVGICVYCLRACASFYVFVCVCMCVGCKTRRAGRGRGYMVGGGVYLFITQRPWRFQGDMATLVLGPLALLCLWPALALPKPSALTSSALCSTLFVPLFLFFRSLGFHFCLSYNVLRSCFCAATSLSLGIWILFCCAAFNVLMMSCTGPDWQVLNLRAGQLS